MTQAAAPLPSSLSFDVEPSAEPQELTIDLTFTDDDPKSIWYSIYRPSFASRQLTQGVAFAIGEEQLAFLFQISDPATTVRFVADGQGDPVLTWFDPTTGETTMPQTSELSLSVDRRALRIVWQRPVPPAQRIWMLRAKIIDEASLDIGEVNLSTLPKHRPEASEPVGPVQAQATNPTHIASEFVDVNGKKLQRFPEIFEYALIPDELQLEPMFSYRAVPGEAVFQLEFHLQQESYAFVPYEQNGQTNISLMFLDLESGGTRPSEPAAFVGASLAGQRACQLELRLLVRPTEQVWAFLLGVTDLNNQQLMPFYPTVVHNPPENPSW